VVMRVPHHVYQAAHFVAEVKAGVLCDKHGHARYCYDDGEPDYDRPTFRPSDVLAGRFTTPTDFVAWFNK
jgi:hypothetical protein